jgi:DNA invertase Pin-like site-specific DNA recombinase
MNEIILKTPDELLELINEALNEKMKVSKEWIKSKLGKKDRLLTRRETAEFLGISLSTLSRWTQKGHIKAYGIEDKIYYKMNELEASLIPIN